MAIDFQHKEYKANIAKWQKIDRICSGDDVTQYLVTLNPNDTSAQNITRNKQYKERAVFYQIAGYTARGLNGLLFSKWPKFNVPAQLEYLATNADGAGVSIYQQAQDTAEDVIKKGRAGLFVSYPETEGAVSRADMDAMRVFSTIHEIDADQILNWRYMLDGAQVKLSLLTFSEVEEETDGYETKEVEQIRELALESGVFVVRKWRLNDKKEWYIYAERIPTDGAGNTWDIIPFTFVGSENNNSSVDDAPMWPLVEINVGHYRNSADYEDNVWYCGQAQPWMSGLTQNHVDLMKSNNMYVGSRELIGVPDGGSFGFESAPPNTMVRQAMLDKLEMMIGLGARFIKRNGPAVTATQAAGDQSVQHSQLSLISSNLSEAYTQCLKWVARYMNVTVTDDMEFTTTMDFVSPTASAQDIQAMVAGFIQGAIPARDYLTWMQKHGLADSEKSLDEFQDELNTGAPMPDLDSGNV